METGDTVYYVPDEAHALNRDHLGNFAWEFGLTSDNPKKDKLHVFSDEELRTFLDKVAKKRPKLLERLVKIRPKIRWPSTVRAVGEGGALDLDVHAFHGITHHVDAVPSGDGTKPRTWCEEES